MDWCALPLHKTSSNNSQSTFSCIWTTKRMREDVLVLHPIHSIRISFFSPLSVARLRTWPHTPPTLFITLLSELVLRYFLQYFFVAFSFLAFPKELEEPEELLQVYNHRDQELRTEDRNITGSVQNVFTSTKQRAARVDLVATWVLKTTGLSCKWWQCYDVQTKKEKWCIKWHVSVLDPYFHLVRRKNGGLYTSMQQYI